MIVVGLTGGMGAGKSSVARLLAQHGAHVVDADAIAREVVEPGTPALAAIADRFGDGIVRSDGTLDRAGLAAIVFDDDDELAALEAITHPAIRVGIEERLAAVGVLEDESGVRQVVVVDHPLLVESGFVDHVDVVVVVEAPLELRLDRLVEGRGVDRDDARARIARQASDEQRRAVADHLVVNDGDEDDLADAVAALWPRLRRTGGTDGTTDGGGRLASPLDTDTDAPEPRRG